MVDEATAGGDANQVMARFIDFWKHSLTDTDYRAGCPVVGLAVDSREDIPDAAELVREIFARWQVSLSNLLAAEGFSAERAQRLATLVVASVEGAIILARARRDLSPLDDVLAEITPLLGAS
jgi:TetR/AcrR family transcriptional repressor of lmrAB and yxaGH operons